MKFLTLISGGLDSAVATAVAARKGSGILGITIEYGQRAAEREVEASRRVCESLRIPHRVVETPWLAENSNSALIRTDVRLPAPSVQELDGDSAEATAASVWVPNRNGVMIQIAAAFAESLGAETVVTGFNLEEGVTFPDNSPEFVEAATKALSFSTRNRVRVYSPLSRMRKGEILKLGKEIDAPLQSIWPCYEGGDRLCGKCESCRRFQRALAETGLGTWYKEICRVGN